MKRTGLVVSRDEELRSLIADILAGAGWSVQKAADLDDLASRMSDLDPDVLILDDVVVSSARKNLSYVNDLNSKCPFIVLAASGNVQVTVSAMKAGALDVLDAADFDKEALCCALEAAEMMRLKSPSSGNAIIDAMIAGTSDESVRTRQRLAGLSSLKQPVLIIGERGVGRSNAARALHEAGPGSSGRFVEIDCANFAPSGGLPEVATIYLDDVQVLSAPAQQFISHKLREFGRVHLEGSPRIVASASPSFNGPERPPFDSRLRADLMRFPIEIGPLRDRLDDVRPIAIDLARKLGERMSRDVTLSKKALRLLATQGWPGNIAQLSQLLERAVAYSTTGRIDLGDIEQLMDDFEDGIASIRRRHGVHQREQLMETLSRTGGNISRAAEELGRSRGAVYRLIEKYGIMLPRTRSTAG